MTRKPDGYVWIGYKDFLEKGLLFSVVPEQDGESVPVCLVSPALLDWVEEVEHILVPLLNGAGISGDLLRGVLDRLKEVRG